MRFFILLLTTLALYLIPAQIMAQANQVQPPLALPSQQQSQTGPAIQTSAPPQLEDIAGPVFIEEQLPWLMIVSALVFGLIALIALFFLVKKLRKPKDVIVAPSVLALKQLDQHKSHLADHGKDRIYISAVTETVRKYIEVEFHLQPTSQTTEEFIKTLGKPTTISELDNKLINHKDQLKELLELSDKTKFAHKPLDKTELEIIDQTARTFIQTSSLTNQPEKGGQS